MAYASARHITIVPEIEMPGHAAAAIAAYPQLGNSDVPDYNPKVMTRWGVHPYTFAPKEDTFRVLEDVLSEVCALFPSKFIHIGGDEAPKTQWNQSKFAQDLMKSEGLKDEEELQSWFVKRIGKFLESKNRRLIVWDEIQEGGLSKTATMMVWREAKWAKHALALGNDVVMATTTHTYFDHYQAPADEELSKGKECECIGDHLPLETVYSHNLTSVAENPAQEKQILGTQGQLWSEYLKDMKKAEYVAFPRVAALAEVAWTPLVRKNYEDFSRRLVGVMKQYDGGNLNHFTPTAPAKTETKDGSTLDTSSAEGEQNNPGWKLQWSDEFEGSAKGIDPQKWTLCERETADWDDPMSADPRCVTMKGGRLQLLGFENDGKDKSALPFLTGGVTTKKELSVQPWQDRDSCAIQECQRCLAGPVAARNRSRMAQERRDRSDGAPEL